MAKAIISYDDTLNDLDALALGRLLASAGTELILAYVRHSTHADLDREWAEASHAQALLARSGGRCRNQIARCADSVWGGTPVAGCTVKRS